MSVMSFRTVDDAGGVTCVCDVFQNGLRIQVV